MRQRTLTLYLEVRFKNPVRPTERSGFIQSRTLDTPKPIKYSTKVQSAGKDCAFVHGEVTLVLTGAFVLAPTALAQVAPLQGNVLGPDGRPLQGADVRVEAKEKPGVPFTAITGKKGQYSFAGLPAGIYRLSVLEGGAVKMSVNMKMRGEKARIDFD